MKPVIRSNRFWAAVIMVLIAGFACTKKPESLVGPSETTNGTEIILAGTSLSIQSPEKHSLYIYNKTFHPIYRSGFTDSLTVVPNLKMEFTFPDTGVYNLFLFNENGDSGYAKTALSIKPGVKDTLQIKLDALGTISGTSHIATTGSAVYIPGSGFGTWFSADRTFQIKGLPSGNFTLKAQPIIKPMTVSLLVLDSTLSITVLPKDTTTIHFK